MSEKERKTKGTANLEEEEMNEITDLTAIRKTREAAWRMAHRGFPKVRELHFAPAPITQLHTRKEKALERIRVREPIFCCNDFSAPDCQPYSMDDPADFGKIVSRDFGIDILLDGAPITDEGFLALGYWDPEGNCWVDGSSPGSGRFSSPEIPRSLICLLTQRLPDLTEQEILDGISAKFAIFLLDNSPD